MKMDIEMANLCIIIPLFSVPVTLSLVGDRDVCPSEPVTVCCVVKKSTQSSFLLWRCSGSSMEDLVICNPIFDFDCKFGKVVDVTGSCECNNTVIVSQATFIANSSNTSSLTCGTNTQQENIRVSVKG